MSQKSGVRWSQQVYAIVFIGIAIVIAYACRHDPFLDPVIPSARTCDPDTMYFEKDILPILQAHCNITGCHNVASSETEDVVLTSYEQVMATADVEPFDPDGSKLYRVLNETDAEDRMPQPPAEPLTETQISMIRTWISQGALNLTCAEDTAAGPCDTANVTYTASVRPVLVNKGCTGCHNASLASGNVTLDTYDGVKVVALDGRLYGSIAHLPQYAPMPQNGNKLDQCTIDKIKIWIDAGAPNN